MAQQVSGPRPRYAKYAALGLIGVALGGAVAWNAADVLAPTTDVRVRAVVFDRSESPPESTAMLVAEPRGGGVTVQAPGWLEADPFYVAATTLADGVVDEVLVLEGDRVERGQVVARLVDEDAVLALERAEAELGVRRAERDIVAARVEAAQTDWDEPVERDRAVAAARAMVAETEAELALLPALIARERATAERLREERERTVRAVASGAATDIELIVATQNLRAQEAALTATERRGAVLNATLDRLRADALAAARHAELRIAEREALAGAKADLLRAESAVRLAEAVVGEARLRLERMTVRAPISGFVQARLKVPGDKAVFAMDAPHSAHILHLYDPAMIQVRVDVPLADASNLFVGQWCEVIVDVLPDTAFAGEVTRITHEADLQKNTLQAKVRVIDPSPYLRPEMLTRVKFLPEGGSARSGDAPSGAGTLLVPEDSLTVLSNGSATIWAVRSRRGDRGVASPVAVEVLSTEAGWARVTGSLQPGDLVAVGPVSLHDGDRVRVHDAAEGGES